MNAQTIHKVHYNVLPTPQQVEEDLRKRIDKETLERWDNAISDDEILIEVFDKNGKKTHTIIGR